MGCGVICFGGLGLRGRWEEFLGWFGLGVDGRGLARFLEYFG